MAANKQYEQYALFKEKQEELSGMLAEASEVIADLNMNQYRENLIKLSEKVHNDTFKVLIVGTFKNGKSTFINSLLGEEVLPAYALPCTAIVNEVKWGEEKKAVVHFRNPLPEKLSSGIPEKAILHMRKYNMKDIPPIEIPYDEIEQYAVISIGRGKDEIDYESPYEKIEVFWPLPILKNGIEIIDSPGLNECGTRTRVTMNYIPRADAILFVLDATRILAADEMHVIEYTLKEHGFHDPFIVVNKFDAIRSREKDSMRQYVRDRLDGFTTNEFFFVSALNALDGKLDDDPDLLRASGMPEFERSLSDFLTRQKGKAKLAQPTRELKRILNEEALFKIIPMQRAALASSLDDIKEKYDKVKPSLSNLTMKKDQLFNQMMLQIERLKPEFMRMVNRNIMEICDRVSVWVDEYEPRTNLGLVPGKAIIEELVREINGYISFMIEKNQLDWRKNVLEPVVGERLREILGAVESDLKNFYDDIDNINVAITGHSYDTETAPAWSRVAGAVGGLIFGGIGGAITGGVNGISVELLKTIGVQAVSIAVLGLIGCLNPVTLIATVILSAIPGLMSGEKKLTKKVKDQIVADTIKQLSTGADEVSLSITNDITAKFAAIAKDIADAMDIEINETENQIGSIIEEMEKGQENISKREMVILNCENKIKSLSIGLDDLIRRLIEE